MRFRSLAMVLPFLAELLAQEAPRAPVAVDPTTGWPVLPAAGATPAAPVQAPVPVPGTGTPAPAPRTAIPQQEHLRDTFRQIGAPANLAQLGGVVARQQWHVLDDQGAELAAFEVFHEADLAHPDRDRLIYTESRRTFGREGAAHWATVHNVLWPSLQQEAREQVELHGLLLRAPWRFADQDDFVLLDRTEVTLDGRALVRIRIESRTRDSFAGPSNEPQPVDRYELYCDPTSLEPVELRYDRTGGTGVRRVLLLDHQPVGSVRLPMRRVWVDADGRRRLEIETVRIEADQRLRVDQFRPPER